MLPLIASKQIGLKEVEKQNLKSALHSLVRTLFSSLVSHSTPICCSCRERFWSTGCCWFCNADYTSLSNKVIFKTWKKNLCISVYFIISESIIFNFKYFLSKVSLKCVIAVVFKWPAKKQNQSHYRANHKLATMNRLMAFPGKFTHFHNPKRSKNKTDHVLVTLKMICRNTNQIITTFDFTHQLDYRS